jgi:hypothetical protein
LAPPEWATASVFEDGGMTHERVSLIHPLVRLWTDTGHPIIQPTEVSVSVVDRRAGTGWLRMPPTIQVEAGSYTLEGVRSLALAIESLRDLTR